MARLPSTHLFELVSSMTKSEKRYFKLNASTQGKDSEYIQIFDELVKMKSYDEEKLIQNLNKKTAVKNLPVKKKYLYGVLLNSLQDFHREKKIEHELLSMLNHILITYNKGLYEHTERLIEKALKLSDQYGKFRYKLILVEWKRSLVNHMQNSKIKEDMSARNANEIVGELEATENELLDVLQIDAESSRIYSKATLVIRFGMYEEIDQMMKDIGEFRSKYPTEDLPFSIRMKIGRAENIMLFAKRDLKEQIRVLLESIELWESNPDMIKEFAQEYLLNLNNILVSTIESGDFSYCDETFKKLRHFMSESNKGTSKIVKTRAFAFYQYNILKYHNTKGDYKETTKAFEKAKFEELGLKLNAYKRTQIIMELVVAHLLQGDYRGVVRRSLDAIANHENLQKEVLSQIRNFFHIAHFHKKNIETLEQRLASKDSLTQDWFQSYPQEKEFLQLLISLGKEEIEKKKVIAFCQEYRSNVNPHFRYYLNLWAKSL